MPEDAGRFMVALGAIIEHATTGRILLLKRSATADFSGGIWEHITGRKHQMEPPHDALRREVREETGLDIEVMCPLGVFHIFRGPEKIPANELVGIVFWCRSADAAVVLSDEHVDYQWLDAEDALALVDNSGIQDDIRRFIRVRSCYR